jgi:LuxR family transcriptional regulator
MSAVLPLLLRIAEAETVADVWAAATGYFAALGFSRVDYGFTRFLHARNIGDPDDAIYLTTGNADHAARYFHNGFFARTPAYRWALAHSGDRTWKWIRDVYRAGQLAPDERAAVEYNMSLGIVAGVTISFPESSARSKGALGLTADAGLTVDQVEEIWERHRTEAMAVAHMMHLRLIQLPQPTQRRSLTQRQREALEWVADGKTTQDVAMLMSVSPAMVEKHLRLAREALAVETTAQAVAKASLLNLIFQRTLETPASGKG